MESFISSFPFSVTIVPTVEFVNAFKVGISKTKSSPLVTLDVSSLYTNIPLNREHVR